VQARDGHRCVNCGNSNVPLDSHHIIERRLFPDGGYYLENGATLCDPGCHRLAEQTLLPCDFLRERCGIKEIVLPPHLYPDETWDKWGNCIHKDGTRSPGELFWDESVQKVLASVMGDFRMYVKPPRTYHLPWSLGKTKDDRVMEDTTFFEGKDVVVTIKQDGENCSIYPDGFVHSRRVEPLNSPNSERIKALAASLSGDLSDGMWLCGESLIRQHTIHYRNLIDHPHWFFQVFNIWKRNQCLSWDEILEWCELLELPTVPVIYRGPWDPSLIKGLWRPTFKGDDCEGYVVRPSGCFHMRDFRRAVGKFVREKFHQPQTHNWRYQSPVFNSSKKE
jgi:hypothetical protein